MSKVALFKVDAYVVKGSFFPLGKIEKDKISRFQTAFPDTLTIFIIDMNDCSLQGFVVDILIHGTHES